MNCRETEPMLSAYMDRELPAWEKTRVADHLSSCNSCRADLDALLQMKRIVRSQPMPEMPTELRHAIELATSQKTRSWKTSWQARWWVPTLAFAAALSGWLLTQAADHYFSRSPDLLVAQPNKQRPGDASQDVARTADVSPSRQIQ